MGCIIFNLRVVATLRFEFDVEHGADEGGELVVLFTISLLQSTRRLRHRQGGCLRFQTGKRDYIHTVRAAVAIVYIHSKDTTNK